MPGADRATIMTLISNTITTDYAYLFNDFWQLHPQEQTYYENIVNIWKASVVDNLKKINEPVDKAE